jgi:hypothetical protein
MDERAQRRIEKALAELGSEHHPPPGWEARVLAATVRRRRRRWVAAGSLVAAAAAVLVLWGIKDRSSPGVELQLAFIHGGEPVRGDAVHLGDAVIATARGGRHRAVWIYHEDQLLLACPGASGCSQEGDALTATARLDRLGEYHIVALADDEPLPTPRGSHDSDVADATRAGVRTRTERLTVR